MGYRSEVILAVGPEVMPQFMVTMAKSPEARKMCFAEADTMIKDYSDIEGAFLFRWDHVKWYDTYKEVAALEEFMNDCDTEDMEDHYRFVRTGEDMDDNDTRGYGFNDIYISRSIDF